MQKKLLALAVAAAISAPAFAADGVNVTVYGKAFASLDSTKTDFFGTDAAGNKVSNSVMTVHTNASRLGFKGDDDLGDGYKATFQYEAEFNVDGNSGPTAAGNTISAGNAFLGTRNSKVGLSIAPVGEFFVGNWDTPYKLSHNPIELLDNTTFGSAVNVVGRLGGSAATNLNTRLKDSFNYHSASFSGFQVKIARGFDDAKTPSNPAPGAPVGSGINQAVTALSATYDDEMFYAGIATQKHKDTNGATNGANLGSSASGTRLVGEYKINGKGFVGVMVEKLKATAAAAAGNTDYSQTNLELSGKFSVTDKDSVGLSYAKAGQTSVNAPAGASKVDSATQVSLRYGHNFSKRSELYVLYTRLKNGAGNQAAGGTTGASNYNFSGGNATALTSQAGATLSGLGVGMIINF